MPGSRLNPEPHGYFSCYKSVNNGKDDNEHLEPSDNHGDKLLRI
jgi:hypothetical protein